MSEVNYNDGLWHGWQCDWESPPVHEETEVEVSNGSGLHRQKSKDTNWGAVIAFRVIKEHKEPRKWWCVLTHMFDTREAAERFDSDLRAANPGMNFGPIFSVREVLE